MAGRRLNPQDRGKTFPLPDDSPFKSGSILFGVTPPADWKQRVARSKAAEKMLADMGEASSDSGDNASVSPSDPTDT